MAWFLLNWTRIKHWDWAKRWKIHQRFSIFVKWSFTNTDFRHTWDKKTTTRQKISSSFFLSCLPEWWNSKWQSTPFSDIPEQTEKVFKNGLSKICGKQPLKNLNMVCLCRPYHFKFFKSCLPQILLDPFLNILSRIILQFHC